MDPLDSADTPAALPASPPPAGQPRGQLTLWDTTSIIVGIIIGSGLYETTPTIARNVPGPGWLIGVWIAGGVFALIGSLCYAELATAYPSDGGDYVYLSRALGRQCGFLFAWAQLWIVRPGSIGAMAYVFARYATELAPLGSRSFSVYAAAAVVVLTAINVLGVKEGKYTQNALTAAKVLGLLSMFAVGMLYTAPAAAATTTEPPRLSLALILVVFTYGGWNDMAYVAAEVRDPRRNIVRALVCGTLVVIGVYVLANLAFLHALGLAGVAASRAVAADVAELALASHGRTAISLLICISTLGAINGMILTGARIYYAMGNDHRLFALVGRWSPRFGTPVWSLVIQAACTLSVVLGFGALDAGGAGQNGFQRLVEFTFPVFWMFLLATGVSLFVLRRRDPLRERPFRVPGYPLVPLAFCAGSAAIVYASVARAIEVRSWEALWSIGLMAVGVVLARWSSRAPR